MLPATIVVTNIPAPNKAPMAKLSFPLLERDTAAMAEKISGAPFPNARNVTPAIFCESRKVFVITVSDGHKKSSAITDSPINKNNHHIIKRIIPALRKGKQSQNKKSV